MSLHKLTIVYSMILVTALCSIALVSPQPPPPAKPCLPDQQEFFGKDPKHQDPSYFAVNFPHGKFAIERSDGSRMVKDFKAQSGARRYDISDQKCTYKSIPQTKDIPQCAPDDAIDELVSWKFKNIDGAYLFYSKNTPSTILKKVSPDGNTFVDFYSWNSTVSKPEVFDIPSDCQPTHIY